MNEHAMDEKACARLGFAAYNEIVHLDHPELNKWMKVGIKSA